MDLHTLRIKIDKLINENGGGTMRVVVLDPRTGLIEDDLSIYSRLWEPSDNENSGALTLDPQTPVAFISIG
jgi:hypothetical protein